MPKHHVEIEWTENAKKSLREIGSRTIQQKIAQKVADLAESGEPERLGKPLVDQLHGLYRISFGRYRIIYRVIRDGRNPQAFHIIIRVLLTGIRKHGDKIDIYEVAQRLQRQGKL
jgi:mRNA-degrading endonuclease RelE of RelBE toxin-antitoxin system